jgi:hypothetical protein
VNTPLLALLLCLLQAPAQVGQVPVEGLRLEIAVRPFLDLYFHVRTLASSKEPAPEFAGFAEAVAAARALDAEFGGPLGWGLVEGLLADCANAKEATAALAGVKETVSLRSGKTVELRTGALRLAAALEQAELAFQERVWPEHQRAIEAARARIEKDFGAKAGECLAHAARSLGLSLEARAIPLRLVHALPAPGAVTQRTSGGAVCFVGVRSFEGTLLFESILHEATHVLDLATPLSSSVLETLRARLEQAGFARADREWRDVPHTLMFVQAGETIRRLVDGKHEHYGVASGYYARVGAIADLELAAWREHLDGKATRAEALERIVAGAGAARVPR